MKALPVLAAACCVLALAGCGNLPNEKTLEDFNPPVVSRLETTTPPAPSESVVLADRILRRESGALLIEAGRRRTLAHEIGSMLSRIRDARPATAEVTARQTHGFGTILVALEPDLFDAVSGLLDDATGPVALRTGHVEFDALNARLGLWGVKLFSSSSLAAFYVDEHANVFLASRLYSALDGIDHAAPDEPAMRRRCVRLTPPPSRPCAASRNGSSPGATGTARRRPAGRNGRRTRREAKSPFACRLRAWSPA